MTGKIHVFPFPNDLYVMFDLLLLLLLARYKTLWYHLYANIIMLCQFAILSICIPYICLFYISFLYMRYHIMVFFCFILLVVEDICWW